MGDLDPTVSNSDAYHTIFENARVRVLEHYDTPHVTRPPRTSTPTASCTR